MLTLPNILTLSRILAIPLLGFFLWWPDWKLGYLIGFALYCLIGITDFFDGYLARAQGTVSKLGIFLDPIADKIMVAAVILILTAQGYMRGPFIGDLHVIAGLVIPMVEFQVFVETALAPSTLPANYLETITVTAQTFETNLEAIVITPVQQSWSMQFILLFIYWLGVLFFAISSLS